MNFWKKAGGVLLALALLIGLLPLSAAAATVCEDGKHTPDLTTLYPADWNSVTGGYGYDYYKCKDCGSACHKNGKSAMLVGPDNGCSGGEKCHLPGATQYPADFDVCNGGYQEPYYRCTHCDRAVDAQGTIIKRYEGAHTPGADLLNPDYIACVGGYQNSYYVCTVCGTPCNADGSTAEWIGPTAKHTPGGARHGADYSACGGGYQEEWYACTICDTPCDENGVDVKWYEPTAKHIPGSARHDANYTACGGGFRKDWYECTVCGQPVDENGNDAEFAEPTAKHIPGAEEHEGNYTSCTGGYTMSWYECTVCGQACDENGDSVTWLEPSGSGHHIPGSEKHDAAPACAGGFLEDWYECTGCGQPVDENGNLIKWTEPTAAHTPGGKKHPADYTLCGGGCKSDYYLCDVCNSTCNADGSSCYYYMPEPGVTHTIGALQAADYTVCGGYKDPYYLCGVCGQAVNPALTWFAMWYEPTDPHTLTKMDALAPTYEADGNVEYWHCTVCGANFYDAQGEKPVEDMDDLLLPKLESRLQTSIKPGLSAVPASVAAQYPTVSDIKQALVSAALTANTTLIGAEANSVLMDVSLQRQNPDGTLTPISAEDFPEEGVEVLLPYPEGTDQTYTFVVTHMITAGAHAGEIEVLANTPEAGGIRVRFTSMSPVCITYQKPAAKPGTDDGKQPGADDAQKPAADIKKPGTTGKNQTGTTTTTTAVKTGDNANLALWGALLVLSALVLTCWLPKKKEQE